jgi:hypothetical protein
MKKILWIATLALSLCWMMISPIAAASEAKPQVPQLSGKGAFSGKAELLMDGKAVAEGIAWDDEGCVHWTDAATEFVLDLQKETEIKEITLEVDNNDNYAIETSSNNVDYKPLLTIKAEYGEQEFGMDLMSSDAAAPSFVKDLEFAPVKARYIKFKSKEGDDQYSCAEFSINKSDIQVIEKPENPSGEALIEPQPGTEEEANQEVKEEAKPDDPKSGEKL